MRAATATDHEERIARVLRHLEANLDAELDIAALAQSAAYAKHHFHRVFRGVTGETVAGHVRRLRLERAARRLRTGGVNVTEAALEAGFTAVEAFSRAFAQHFGTPPLAYRGEPSPRVRALPDDVAMPAVEVRSEAAVNLLTLRHVGPFAGVGATFAALVAEAGAAGLLGHGPRLHGLCHDDADVTRAEQLRFDAGLVVPTGASAGRLVPATVPAGRYAVAVHEGSYAHLADTYLALIGRWWPRTRHQLADEPVVEVYLNDPRRTPEADLRTEVRVRLAR